MIKGWRESEQRRAGHGHELGVGARAFQTQHLGGQTLAHPAVDTRAAGATRGQAQGDHLVAGFPWARIGRGPNDRSAELVAHDQTLERQVVGGMEVRAADATGIDAQHDLTGLW